MTTPFRRLRRLLPGSAAAAALTLCLVAAALVFSAPAGARAQAVHCNTDVTGAPSPGDNVTVSAASTAYGKVLVVGSAPFKGCALYVLTSDQASAGTYGCRDATALDESCSRHLWPALLTDGDPIAGPGVNPTLLSTVTRTDVISGESVRQVTYAGQPLYRFFMDEGPGETDGVNLFDPVTDPTGIWYLVAPSRGLPAPGRAQLQLETFNATTGQQQTVLAASMNDGFRLFPDKPFPVYTFSGDSCTGQCAVDWPPVLTSGQPEAIGYAVDQHALGTIVRPDGTHQVTYHGKPLYLDIDDAYLGFPPFNGSPSINGDGVSDYGGMFNAISLP